MDWVTHADATCSLCKGIYKLIRKILLDQETRAAGTDLPTVEIARKQRTCEGLLHIGISKDNVWRLAAQLEMHALDGVCRYPENFLSHLGASGKRNFGNARVTCQCCAGG